MNAVKDLAKAIARSDFAKGGLRQCVKCREPFDAEGMQTICDGCSALEAENKRQGLANEPLPWPDCWPRRVIEDIATLDGERLAHVKSMLGGIMDGDATIAIIGDRGRGKSVMAAWLADQRRMIGRSPGIYTRVHDLFATIRRAWHPQSKEDEWTVLERYRSTALLVIDEFQERSESEWENRTLVNILDHRHGDMLPTIIIANLNEAEFGKQLGPSLVDRLAQTGGIIECTWGNLR